MDKLKSFVDERGSLTPIELSGFNLFLFAPARLFYITNVPVNTVRGNHAHKECYQYLICLQGAIEVTTSDGNSVTNNLLRKDEGMLIKPLTWDSQLFLTGNDVLLVLCSHTFDESDYIRDWKEFLKLTNN